VVLLCGSLLDAEVHERERGEEAHGHRTGLCIDLP
jgi:hypothetical protein